MGVREYGGDGETERNRLTRGCGDAETRGKGELHPLAPVIPGRALAMIRNPSMTVIGNLEVGPKRSRFL